MQSSRRVVSAFAGMNKLQKKNAVAWQSFEASALRKIHSSSIQFAEAKSAYPSLSRHLFEGHVETASVAPYPVPQGLSAEQKDTIGGFIDPIDNFLTTENNAAENDRNGTIPDSVRQGLADMGLYGIQSPEEFNGLGLNNVGYARINEILGSHDLGLAIMLSAHQSIGFKGILLFGTPEQKAKYLPVVSKGEKSAAFALTEPSTGSDANSVKTRATLGSDGKWYLNGGKWFITNGGEAEIFTVFAQTEVTDPKTGEKSDKVTAFIVERSFGGVTNGPPEKKMGIKCSNTTEVFFDNTPVPAENVLGGVGNGFKVAMEILNNGRFGMGATITGTMKSVIKGATEHVAQRVQFGKKLAEFEGVKIKLTDMAVRVYATESMAYLLASNMDRGMKDYQLEAAISKIFSSDSAWYVADECIQLMGGLGFMNSLPYERVQRDLRIFRIFEGTNDILRYMVASTGLQSLAKKLQAGESITPAAPYKPAILAEEAAALAEVAKELNAASIRLLKTFGKSIANEQAVLTRVADIVIDLTVAHATIARANKSKELGLSTAAHEEALARVFAQEAALRAKANLEKLADPKITALDKQKVAISADILAHSGVFAVSPLGF